MSERLRVGIGFDADAFADGRRLVLAGVEIPSARGLAGHSDADLISHAVTDALLGAAGGADIGELYPSDDPALEGASSVELLRRAWATLAERGWSIVNVDAIVIMQEPRLAPHRKAMREALAAASGIYDSMAHPDLAKVFGQRPDRPQVLYRQIADGFEAAGVCAEVSSAGYRQTLDELYPDPELLAMLHERGVPVTLGSDAHAPERVGRDFPRALREMHAAGYRTLTVFDRRERRQEVFDV